MLSVKKGGSDQSNVWAQTSLKKERPTLSCVHPQKPIKIQTQFEQLWNAGSSEFKGFEGAFRSLVFFKRNNQWKYRTGTRVHWDEKRTLQLALIMETCTDYVVWTLDEKSVSGMSNPGYRMPWKPTTWSAAKMDFRGHQGPFFEAKLQLIGSFWWVIQLSRLKQYQKSVKN